MTARPNFLILILDALRARNVAAYGYPGRTTPCLDAFAAESVLFRRAFSAATWTIPSHASLLSGLYVSQHRIESIESDRRFNERIVTLPDALRNQGYRTAGFSQNMLFGPNHHLEAGFDEFHNVDEFLQDGALARWALKWSDGAKGARRLAARYIRKMLAPRRLLDGLHDWLTAPGGRQPRFVMANVLAPHFPWTAPPSVLLRRGFLNPRYLVNSDYLTLKRQWEFNAGKRRVTDMHRRAWSALYDCCLFHADQEVGRFFERLRRWDGWKNTIVVVTSDHGEMLGDYRDIVGHMLSLHDNLIHVPLILKHPDYGGTVVQGVVQTLDLYPSVLEWAGCSGDGVPAAQLQRPSLARALDNPGDYSGYAFAEEDYTDSYDVPARLLEANPAMDPARYPRCQRAVRSATHKYVWCNDRPGELYDLVCDPQEQHNVIDDESPAVRKVLGQLQSAMDDWHSGLEILPPVSPDQVEPPDAVVLERLRALGYVL